MKFCSTCGAPVERRIPTGEDRERYVCASCGAIHYENPRMVVSCIIEEQGSSCSASARSNRVTATGPYPQAFSSWARVRCRGDPRDVRRGGRARASPGAVRALRHPVHRTGLHLFYRARMLTPEFSAGSESLEVELVAPEQIPWGSWRFRSCACRSSCTWRIRAPATSARTTASSRATRRAATLCWSTSRVAGRQLIVAPG